MSHEQNTILEENAWEAFNEQYETDPEFQELIQSKFTHEETWRMKEYCPVKAEFEALCRIFEAEYSPLL